MATVAVVVLDSVRADRFDTYFDWLPGRSFENAYSTANWTAPSHASLLTGRYGSEVGVLPADPTLKDRFDYLPQTVNKTGYVTTGLSANPFFSARFGWDRGFETFRGPADLKNPSDTNYFDWSPYTTSPGDGALTAGRRYLRGAISCIRSNADTMASLCRAYELKVGGHAASNEVEDDGAETVREFVSEWTPDDDEFLVVNLMEAHVPYAPPVPYWNGPPVYLTASHALNDADAPADAKQAYDAAVEYLADTYKGIFSHLADKCDYVITCADHGELLGEHNGRWNHVYGVYPELAQIPLVISGDGLSGTVRETVNILDIHRTLADMMGVETTSRGQSLLNSIGGCDRLVEYRGLIDLAKDRLRESGTSESTIDEYDRPLFGLVRGDGLYAFEGPDGTLNGEATMESVESRLDSLKNQLRDPKMRSEMDEEIEEDVRRRLDDLGYM